MTIPALEILAQNRATLLQAEIAAWLHDCYKCSDEFLQSKQEGSTTQNTKLKLLLAPGSSKQKNIKLELLPELLSEEANEQLKQCRIHLDGETCSVFELIGKGMPENIADTGEPLLIRYLGKCHGVAHADKEDGGSQQKDEPRPSSPFGHEGAPLQNLTQSLKNLPFDKINKIENACYAEEYRAFVAAVRTTFATALGDTRCPINEVTLEDWSAIVAALYKSALAGKLLGFAPDPDDLRWQILRVNLDVLGLYSRALKISDLLGYQTVVEEAFEAIRQLIEEQYPLGNELYRDMTGIYFTFPNIPLPLELEERIREEVKRIDVDLIVQIGLTPMEISDALKSNREAPQEALKILLQKARQQAEENLRYPFRTVTVSHPAAGIGQQSSDLCPVCRMRPQDKRLKICQQCNNRRQKRFEHWLGDRQSTIWNGEVADSHGRLALLVGKFNLESWLSGDMVRTLFWSKKNKKNPAPARLRRIWRTTDRFWEEVNELAADKVSRQTGRLKIKGRFESASGRTSLSSTVYELIVEGRAINAAWSEQEKLFIVCDQLQYLAGETMFARELKQVLRAGAVLTVRTSSGYGSQAQTLGELHVECVLDDPTPYSPVISILKDPLLWMVLIPADEALKLLHAIQQKYELEMNKVRNRLALTLGVVYFSQETPLAAAIEASRRMLTHPVRPIPARVQNISPESSSKRPLTLTAGSRSISIYVETRMGDGQTEDHWYVRWKIYKAPHAHESSGHEEQQSDWLNIRELKKSVEIEFIPSTFDYEWLDTTGRRMEIAYHPMPGDPPGWTSRRMPAQSHRPYYLEELHDLERLAGQVVLSPHLSKSQLYAVRDLIEAKRQLWQKPVGHAALSLPNDDVFRCFVKDVLKEAKMYDEELERAALSGMFRDAIELYQMLSSQTSQGGMYV
mgnify:CR=1 FL=1